MYRYKKYILLVLSLGLAACSPTIPVFYGSIISYSAVQALKIGTPALPYYTMSQTTLEAINQEFEKAGAKVTIADTYQYGYGKSFQGLPVVGDTGQVFTDMSAATKYFQNILKAKGLSDADRYFLTSIDSAKKFGFTLIAAVYRTDNSIAVLDKFGASVKKNLYCDDPPYFLPYRYDCNGKPLDTVYEWAAVPNECFQKQGDQAIFLTLAANKVLEKKPKDDYWAAESKWISGDYKSVVIAQDYMVCQQLGIEKGYTQQKNVFKN